MIIPVCELPREVAEVWLAKLLPEGFNFENYSEESGSISIDQTLGRGELHIWKRDEKYELICLVDKGEYFW